MGKVLGLALALLSAEAWAGAPPATTTPAATTQTTTTPATTTPATTMPAAEAHEAARKLSAQAVKLYDLGEFALSLELFEKADALYPSPSYRVYMARAYAKLGKVRKSVATYDEAIHMTRPPSAPAGFVEAQQAAAEERAETAKRLAVLRIDVTGARAEDVTLTVDGETVSAASRLRVELDPGRHQIAATSPQTAARSQSVELKEGASSTVSLALEPRDGSVPPFRPLAITAAALSGAGLVVAVASGVVLAEKHNAILQECPNRVCSPAGRALIQSVSPINDVNLAGIVVAAASGTAAAVFLTLHLRGPKSATATATTTAIVPAPLPGGGGLWVTRSF